MSKFQITPLFSTKFFKYNTRDLVDRLIELLRREINEATIKK
jgi:hypothetical protein